MELCRMRELNPQPTAYKAVALPIELIRHGKDRFKDLPHLSERSRTLRRSAGAGRLISATPDGHQVRLKPFPPPRHLPFYNYIISFFIKIVNRNLFMEVFLSTLFIDNYIISYKKQFVKAKK